MDTVLCMTMSEWRSVEFWTLRDCVRTYEGSVEDRSLDLQILNATDENIE